MNEPAPPSPRPVPTWQLWLWPLILVGLAFAAWLLPWRDWVPILRDWVEGHGMLGGVVFVIVYIGVVVLPLPAAAMSVVGGLAFGWWGYPLSMLGAVLGAILPYWVGRRWLRAPLLRRIGGPRVLAADRAIGENAALFVTFLRLTPILPFTAQNWLLGLTAVRPWTYIWATCVGLAPGTLAMVWIGEMGGLAASEAQARQIWLAAVGLCIVGIMVLWMARTATRALKKAGFVRDPARPSGVDGPDLG